MRNIINIILKEPKNFYIFIFRIIDKNDGKAPPTYRQFINMISAMRPPPIPVPHVSVKVSYLVKYLDRY